MSTEKIPIGSRVKEARKAAGLTLVELGRLIGIGNSALSMIERSQRNPSRQTLTALSKELKVDFGEGHRDEDSRGEGPRSCLRMRELERYGTTEAGMAEPLTSFDFEGLTATGTIVRGDQKAVLVAVFGRVSEGKLTWASPDDRCDVYWFPGEGFEPGYRAYALQVEDSSLSEAHLLPQDILAYQEVGGPRDGMIVVTMVGEKLVIKRWSEKGGSVSLASIGRHRRKITVAAGELEVLGRYVGMVRVIRERR